MTNTTTLQSINVNANNELVVTFANKEVIFTKEGSSTGIIGEFADLPFAVPDEIQTEIRDNTWVSSYVCQNQNDKLVVLLMAGTEVEMRGGRISMSWLIEDASIPMSVAHTGTVVREDDDMVVINTDIGEFTLLRSESRIGLLATGSELGVVLPAVVAMDIVSPAYNAFYIYDTEKKNLVVGLVEVGSTTGIAHHCYVMANVDVIIPETNPLEEAFNH